MEDTTMAEFFAKFEAIIKAYFISAAGGHIILLLL
jgi:hypothetical protein